MFRRSFSAFRRSLLRLTRLEERTTPAIISVTNLNDAGAGSLRQAILDANGTTASDTILIETQGTLVLSTGQMNITTDLAIVGPGAGSLTISGAGLSRIFEIDDTIAGTEISVTISRMTLSGGNAGGGLGGAIRVADENFNVSDVNFFNNTAARGGAIDVANNGRLTMDRCTLSGNSAASFGGGAMYLDDNSVNILRDCVITGNTATGDDGGGIYLDIGGTLRVERSQVSYNQTTGDGGGIFVFSRGSLTVISSTLAFNVAGGIGGAIDTGEAEFRLENSTISGNSASRGAGVYISSYYNGPGKRPSLTEGEGDRPATILSSTIVNNSANNTTGTGGGVFSVRGVSISDSIVSGNSAFEDPDLADGSYGSFATSYSLILTQGAATIINIGGNIFGVAPILGPLTINGDTKLPTHALLADSRGLNEGNPMYAGPATDERGLPRIAGPRVDMGAHETEFGFVRGKVLYSDGVNPDSGNPNVFVWLDRNGNGSPDNDEVATLTDNDGNYLLADLPGDYDPYRALRAGLFQLQAGPPRQTLVAGVTNNVSSWIDRPITGLKAFNGSDVLPSGVAAGVVDFRLALGALNPNVAGTQNNGAGRREINWDGVPDQFSAPNNLPANFFNSNSPRGAVFVGQGTGFQVSADSSNPTNTPTLFDNLNTGNSANFSTFSPQRLFTPLGTNVYDVEFFVPGTTNRATVSAFGAVFIDAENAVESSLEFFDADGNSLGVFLVPHVERRQVPDRPEGGAQSQLGQSFLGVQFTDNRRAAKVRITTGNTNIGANDNFRSHDVVVLDDFIYSEPVAINTTPPVVQPIPLSAVGSGVGGNSTVLVYDQTGKQVASFQAFDSSFRGEVHVATADIDGDGVEDVITGAGAGGGPHVQVYGGAKLLNGVAERIVTPLGSFFAFTPEFKGGVNVSAGDVNGDGRADIVIGAGPGGGPHVITFSGANATVLSSFFAYDAGFKGGVNVAGGDFNGDGKADIATGAGPGGGPHVRVFDIANKGTLADFFAYDAAFHGGVYVAAGDVLQNGKADLITGAGAGGGPHVRVFDGATFLAARDFFAYDAAFSGGVRVAAVRAFGMDYIATAAGPGGGPHIRVVDKDLNQLNSFYAFGNKDFNGGVFVG